MPGTTPLVTLGLPSLIPEPEGEDDDDDDDERGEMYFLYAAAAAEGSMKAFWSCWSGSLKDMTYWVLAAGLVVLRERAR